MSGAGFPTATTQDQHRPKSHQAHLEWTPSRIIAWAATAGPSVGQLVEAILASRPHPEAGYRFLPGADSSGQDLQSGTTGKSRGSRPRPTGLLLYQRELDLGTWPGSSALIPR